MIISKFKGITFPLFALKNKPYKMLYGIDKMYIIKHEGSHKETLDDKRISGDYFSRLLKLENRVTFDYTCKNIQDIIYTAPKWGIDSLARPFDLSKKELVQAKVVKIKKINNNLIWLNSISYPFRLNTKERLEIADDAYAVIVQVNNEWFIKEFLMDPIAMNKIIYI